MFHYVGETSGPVIMGILLFIIVWEMLQIVFGILVKFTPPLLEEPPPPTEPEPKPSLPKVESPPVVQVEQYIPHARPSTFDHPDLNRIKSTEIW
ncbi:hypothetical protein Btru_063283 [Bulinus truncatus]|nr:hypothetical protein Btru_063283 [Bulinus truncatus]